MPPPIDADIAAVDADIVVISVDDDDRLLHMLLMLLFDDDDSVDDTSKRVDAVSATIGIIDCSSRMNRSSSCRYLDAKT